MAGRRRRGGARRSTATRKQAAAAVAATFEDPVPSCSGWAPPGSGRANKGKSGASRSRREPAVPDPQVDSEVDVIRGRLVEAGYMSKLRDLMESKLSYVGWRIALMRKGREIADKEGPDIKFETLFAAMKEFGMERIPDELMEEFLFQVKYAYESLDAKPRDEKKDDEESENDKENE